MAFIWVGTRFGTRVLRYHEIAARVAGTLILRSRYYRVYRVARANQRSSLSEMKFNTRTDTRLFALFFPPLHRVPSGIYPFNNHRTIRASNVLRVSRVRTSSPFNIFIFDLYESPNDAETRADNCSWEISTYVRTRVYPLVRIGNYIFLDATRFFLLPLSTLFGGRFRSARIV